MKTLELAKHRKTVRKFNEVPVPVEQVKKAISVALEAPSGANYQGWRFSIILNQELKRRIREASEAGEKKFYKKVSGDWGRWLEKSEISWMKPYLEEAPILLVIYGNRSVPYSTESVWLMIGYLLLAFEELGLSTVTYTPSYPERVEDVLMVPKGFGLEAILPIGFGDDEKPKEPRKEVDSLIELYE